MFRILGALGGGRLIVDRRRIVFAVAFAALSMLLVGFPVDGASGMFPWGTLVIALFLVLLGYRMWPGFESTWQTTNRQGFNLTPNPARVQFALLSAAVATLAVLLVPMLLSLFLPYDLTVAGVIRAFLIVALIMYVARPGGRHQPGSSQA
jgi:hypothetical protein